MYTDWFLCERFTKPHTADRLALLAKNKEWCRTQAKNIGLIQELVSRIVDLDDLLAEIAETIDPAWLEQWSADTAEDLRTAIKYLVDEIQQMRPFLVRNFRCEKTILKLSDELCLAFDWAVGMAIGVISNAPTVDKLREVTVRRESCFPPELYLDHEGLLSDSRMPWRTTADIGVVGSTTALHINLYVLELFHEKLLSFYDKIDFEAIRRRLRQADKTDLDDEELGITCQDLTEAESLDEPPDDIGQPKPRIRIGPLRLQRLLIVLQEDLGCEVSQGKGSEIRVYRPGGRIYVLGHHKADYAVPVPVVRALLSRVGIGAREWIAACHRNGRIRLPR